MRRQFPGGAASAGSTVSVGGAMTNLTVRIEYQSAPRGYYVRVLNADRTMSHLSAHFTLRGAESKAARVVRAFREIEAANMRLLAEATRNVSA